jgi:hypothetical protein
MKISNRLKISKRLKKIIGLLKSFSGIIILSFFLNPFIAQAQWAITGPGSLNGSTLDVLLENVIVGILGLIGILGILYLVYGGIRYVTAGGSDSEIEEAKRIITNAIYGLFFVSAAYAIVKTVVAFVG